MSPALSVHLDHPETKDLQGKRAPVDRRVLAEKVERMATKELLDSKDHSDFRAHKDPQAHLAPRDNPAGLSKSTDLPVRKDLPGNQGLQARKEFPERTEPMSVECRDLKATMEILVHRVNQGLKVPLDPKGLLASRALANTALRHALLLATNWLLAAVRTTIDKNKALNTKHN